MPASLKKWLQADTTIWVVIILLLLISLLSVYSATGSLAYRWKQGDTSIYILRHGAFMLAGVVCMFATMHINYRIFARLSGFLFGVTIVLLVFTLFFGVTENDAVRRLSIGGFTFQTSDMAKITLIMYIARELAVKQEKLGDMRRTILPLFLKVIIVFALILPANLSTAGLILLGSISLMYIGMVPLKHMAVLCCCAGLCLVLFFSASLMIEKNGGHTQITGRAVTWVNRITNFGSNKEWTAEQLASESEKERQLTENYQKEQAKIAVGTGGVFGKGPGQSTQRNFLPHPYSDFIYSIIIEEYGLFGGVVVMLLYILLFHRAAVIVKRSERSFPAYLAIGLTLLMVYQAMIHMCVSVGGMPITGQPLPLVSMGGTAMISTGISLGMLLSISREMKTLEEQNKTQELTQEEKLSHTEGEIDSDTHQSSIDASKTAMI